MKTGIGSVKRGISILVTAIVVLAPAWGFASHEKRRVEVKHSEETKTETRYREIRIQHAAEYRTETRYREIRTFHPAEYRNWTHMHGSVKHEHRDMIRGPWTEVKRVPYQVQVLVKPAWTEVRREAYQVRVVVKPAWTEVRFETIPHAVVAPAPPAVPRPPATVATVTPPSGSSQRSAPAVQTLTQQQGRSTSAGTSSFQPSGPIGTGSGGGARPPGQQQVTLQGQLQASPSGQQQPQRPQGQQQVQTQTTPQPPGRLAQGPQSQAQPQTVATTGSQLTTQGQSVQGQQPSQVAQQASSQGQQTGLTGLASVTTGNAVSTPPFAPPPQPFRYRDSSERNRSLTEIGALANQLRVTVRTTGLSDGELKKTREELSEKLYLQREAKRMASGNITVAGMNHLVGDKKDYVDWEVLAKNLESPDKHFKAVMWTRNLDLSDDAIKKNPEYRAAVSTVLTGIVQAIRAGQPVNIVGHSEGANIAYEALLEFSNDSRFAKQREELIKKKLEVRFITAGTLMEKFDGAGVLGLGKEKLEVPSVVTKWVNFHSPQDGFSSELKVSTPSKFEDIRLKDAGHSDYYTGEYRETLLSKLGSVTE